MDSRTNLDVGEERLELPKSSPESRGEATQILESIINDVLGVIKIVLLLLRRGQLPPPLAIDQGKLGEVILLKER